VQGCGRQRKEGVKIVFHNSVTGISESESVVK
jgi:hypothetical protein